MSDWYLVRQLEYFKARVRGGHEGDIYGDQMNMIANSLRGARSHQRRRGVHQYAPLT